MQQGSVVFTLGASDSTCKLVHVNKETQLLKQILLVQGFSKMSSHLFIWLLSHTHVCEYCISLLHFSDS